MEEKSQVKVLIETGSFSHYKMNGESKGVKSDQFPVNLQEGLGVTPLTYLIPTQDRMYESRLQAPSFLLLTLPKWPH